MTRRSGAASRRASARSRGCASTPATTSTCVSADPPRRPPKQGASPMPDDGRYPLVETLPMASMPLSYQMYMDPEKRERMTKLAQILAGARGFVPKFLEDNQYSCFAVVCRSITWKLDMFAVAQSCYEVGGKIAYEGKLVQAVLAASGRLTGGVKYDHYGDWNRLRGKFKMVAS